MMNWKGKDLWSYLEFFAAVLMILLLFLLRIDNRKIQLTIMIMEIKIIICKNKGQN
jgi:hypothetical protein